MAEYIEREALINDFNSYGSCFAYGVHRVAAIISRIKLQPAADVIEVVHGEWFLLDDCSNEGVYCSVCHKKVYKTNYANQKIKSPYCPNCGAKMDGERKCEDG